MPRITPKGHQPSRFAPWLLALAGCGSTPEAPSDPRTDVAQEEPTRRETPPREQPPILRGAPIVLDDSVEAHEIAGLEYRRSTGNDRLLELLQDRDADVRERAAVACGRLPWPAFGEAVTDALSLRLDDPVRPVRYAAAFALGQRGDPRAAGTLASYRNDPDPLMRARVIEAASRMPDAQLHEELLIGLRDTDPRVRIETAIATARWSRDQEGAADADTVDRALLDALRPYQLRPGDDGGARIEPEFVWRVLYALSRRRAELGRGAFLEYAGASGTLDRLFAVRGLARIEVDDETGPALARALDDPEVDWRVAYEAALGLAAWDDPRALPPLLRAVEHPDPHVRGAAMQALGSYASDADVLTSLRRGQLDVSAEVRVAALGSLARVLPTADALTILTKESRGEDAVLRAGVAAACAELEDPGVLPLLNALARDRDLRVATTAVTALGNHLDPQVRAQLHELLKAPDNGLRLAAVLALRETPDPTDRTPLELAFQSTQGDIAAEVAFNVLENLGAIGDGPSKTFVQAALEDPRPHVRRVAARVLEASFSTTGAAVDANGPVSGDARAPLPGKDYPVYGFNPLIEVQTSRGSLVFELFPAEAPVHVHNFLELARRGDYDGLSFHRVVPDFVIQGGDYRGDGNGGRSWNGAAVPQEFTPRKSIRGSLGMPRNEDPDSGGSQFFVTHRPTPHLDGNYTFFGELRQGGDVLDRIEVGDRILSVRPMR